MNAFEPGTLVSVLTADLDAAACAAPLWRGEVLQLSPGRLRWRTDAFHTRRLQLASTEWSPGVELDLAPPPGAVVFALFAPCCGLMTLGRSPASADEVLVLAPGERLQLRSLGTGGMLTLAIGQEALEQGAAVEGRSVLERRCGDRLRLRDDAQGESVFERLAAFLQALRSEPAQIGDAGFLARVEDSVLQAVLSVLEPPAQPHVPAARHRLARRAAELLRAHIDEPILLQQLCDKLGVNASSLHQGFLECFGASPKAYLRNLRLNGARRQLAGALAPTSVTEVALDWGFAHFGRFAQDYSRLFGETPSTTLRGSRLRRQSAAPVAAATLEALLRQEAGEEPPRQPQRSILTSLPRPFDGGGQAARGRPPAAAVGLSG